jgi:PAS domain-containing protein
MLNDQDEREKRAVITFLDVTDLKNAEASLRNRETRLALALDAGGMGAWEWDIRGGGVVWNDRMFALLGLDPMLTAPSSDIFSNASTLTTN